MSAVLSPQCFHGGRVQLYAGDCLDVLDHLAENSIDSCVVDPPYHLTSIVKRFGADQAAPAKHGTDGAFARAARGFMGRTWDGGDVAFQPETWAKVWRVLKPGAYIVAFSSSRTFGRMSVAIEDAGFITHPLIGWLFGSGFPKATRIKAEGYEGFRYGGQALKPALEPIYVGQKPFSEENGTANILKWGTGAVNIEGCRINAPDGVPKFTHRGDPAENCYGDGKNGSNRTGQIDRSTGRWPANLIHDGSPEVLAGFPDVHGAGSSRNGKFGGEYEASSFDMGGAREMGRFGDSGSAARFFYCVEKDCICDLCGVRWSSKDGSNEACNANPATPNFIHPETGLNGSALSDVADLLSREGVGKSHQNHVPARNAGVHSSDCLPQSGNSVQSSALDSEALRIAQNVRSAASLCVLCETAIARSLAAMRLGLDPASHRCLDSTPERIKPILSRSLAAYAAGRESTDIITTTASLKTLLGSVFHAIGDTTNSGRAENSASSDPDQRRFRYSSKADADDRLGSRHPTVKPLDLMRWLVRLVTPPRGTTIDPFAGTGTTGHAALIEGMRAILIERDAEYQADIARRMDLVFAGPDERTRRLATPDPHESMPLFGAAS